MNFYILHISTWDTVPKCSIKITMLENKSRVLTINWSREPVGYKIKLKLCCMHWITGSYIVHSQRIWQPIHECALSYRLRPWCNNTLIDSVHCLVKYYIHNIVLYIYFTYLDIRYQLHTYVYLFYINEWIYKWVFVS